jgi:hypothetical protein
MTAIDLLKLCLLGWVIGAAGLWIAKVITRVHCTFPRFLLIVTSPILISLLPLPWFVNYVIAVILMYVLIVKLTDASWFPDAVLMVAIGNIISISIALLYLYKSGVIGGIQEKVLSHF